MKARIREFCVRQAANGYIVDVGCQRFVFSDRTRLLDAIDSYLADPAEYEKFWLKELGVEETLALPPAGTYGLSMAQSATGTDYAVPNPIYPVSRGCAALANPIAIPRGLV